MTIFMFYLCVISLALPPITAIVVGIVETIKKLFTNKQQKQEKQFLSSVDELTIR